MSKSILSKLSMFVVGAVIGSAATWKLLKTKYEQIANEEIESVKREFGKLREDEEEGRIVGVLDEPEEPEEYESKVPSSLAAEYAKIIKEFGYSEEPQEAKGDEDVERPYVITPEDFGEMDDYETVSLTYYADGVLADDQGNIIEDPDNVVGEDFESHYGEYEDDSVFVRNDATKCDYEILKDYSRYSDNYPVSMED